MPIATYVHNLDPVIFRVTEAIALRWYGLAYLAAFIAGAALLEVLSRRKLWVLPPKSAGDFISAAAIFGVIFHRVGLSDTALPVVVRAVAVGVALYSLGGALVEETISLTEQAWGALAAVGGRR